jgi:Fe-S-cluster containining protein
MSSFPCSGCGLCCKLVGAAVTGAKALIAAGNNKADVLEVANFPYSFNDHGHCENLNQDNTCKIYDHRPDICQIDKVWEKHHQHEMTKEQYFQSAAIVCNSLMVQVGVDEKYYIPVEKGTDCLL